jgi:hypothetical protein
VDDFYTLRNAHGLTLIGVWFAEQERQLSDFEKFENATQGLTGSVMLLWKLRGR